MKNKIFLVTILITTSNYSHAMEPKKVILQKLLKKYCTKDNVIKNDKRAWYGAYTKNSHQSHSFSCSNKINIVFDSKSDQTYHYISVDAKAFNNRSLNVLAIDNKDITFAKYEVILNQLNHTKRNSPNYKEESLSDYSKYLAKKNQERDNLLQELLN